MKSAVVSRTSPNPSETCRRRARLFADGKCRQIHITRHFSHAHCTRLIMCTLTAWLKCLQAGVIPSSCHPWRAFHRPFLVVSSFCLPPCFSLSPTSSLPTSTCTLTCTPPSMWTAPRERPAAPSPHEEYCNLAIFTLSQVMSPTSSTTSTAQRLLK